MPARYTRGMRLAWIVVLLAVVVRLAPITDGGRALFSDERDYDRLARTLAAAGRYEEEGRPTAYRPVGYPAFVAAVYRVAGPRPEAVRIAQALLDAATALLLFLLVRNRGRRAALGAAVLWAAYPPAVLYSRFLRPETLTAFLLVAIALALSRESSMPRLGRFFLGLLLGGMTLVRSEFALVLPVIPFVIDRGTGRWARAAVLLAGASVVLVPWVARNAVAVGAPTLSTSFGGLVLIGNHPAATGGYAPAVPDSMRPRATGEVGSSREAYGHAARYIQSHPARFISGIARKWAVTLMGESELVVTSFHPSPADGSTSFREKARALPLWIHAAASVPYGLLLLIGVLGYLTPPGGVAPRFFLAIMAAWLIAHGITFGGSRYHFPWMPFLTASAALFLTGVRPRLAAMTTGSWLLAGSITAAAIGVWILEIQYLWFR